MTNYNSDKDGNDGYAIVVKDYRGPKPKDFNESFDIVIKVRRDFFFINLEDWRYFEETRIYNSGNRGYLSAKFGGGDRSYFHRFVLGNPEGMVVDHINHNVRDNRRCNLRVVFSSQNNSNARRVSKEGYRGVSKKRYGYEANVVFQRKKVYGGLHKTPEDAARAYDELAIKYFGKCCITNFPRSESDTTSIVSVAEEKLKPASFKWGKDKCARDGCKRFSIEGSELCLTHTQFKQRKEERIATGQKINAERVKEKTETCLKCDKPTFARNLCGPHHAEALKAEGYVKPPKKKYPCSVDGCETPADKIKERLCRQHWNEKHGVVSKRFGRPKAARVQCACGKDASANTGLCTGCYRKVWEKKKAEAVLEK